MRSTLIRMTSSLRARIAQFTGVVLALFAGSAVAAAVAPDDPDQPAILVAGEAASDPTAVERAKAVAERTGAPLRVVRTPADELGAAHLLAARGHDTIITVGADRERSIAPVAARYPGVRFVAKDSNQLDARLSR